MHFFMSLIYTGWAVVLEILYVSMAILLGYSLVCVGRAYFHKPKKSEDSFKPHCRLKNILPWLGYALASVVFVNSILYVQLRLEWMGDDNTHLTAKEYFLAGQIADVPTEIMTVFLHPENWLLRPFTALKEKIYARGIGHLPADDGEKAIWRHMWFLHNFVKKDRVTKDGSNVRLSPDMIKLLDDIWWALEQQGTLSLVDSQMRKEQYYRNYPGLATYYTRHESQYMQKTAGAGPIMAKDPHFVNRSRQLCGWLEELGQKWQESPETYQYIKAYPKIMVLLQVAIIGTLYRTISAEIYAREFSCERHSVKLYVQTVNDFVGSPANRSPLMRLGSTERKRLYNGYINNVYARFSKRMLLEYCGLEVLGKESLLYLGWDDRVKSLYKEEYQILEEMNHGQ